MFPVLNLETIFLCVCFSELKRKHNLLKYFPLSLVIITSLSLSGKNDVSTSGFFPGFLFFKGTTARNKKKALMLSRPLRLPPLHLRKEAF